MNLLRWFNTLFAAGIFLAVLVGISLALTSPSSSLNGGAEPLPPGDGASVSKPFLLEPSKYAHIGKPVLDLEFEPVSIQLPLLSSHLQFFGKNTRPDRGTEVAPFQFGLQGSDQIVLVLPGQRTYLRFVRDVSGGRYEIVDGDTPTDLWFDAREVENSPERVEVAVGMRDLRGNFVTEPEERRTLLLVKLPWAKPISTAGGPGGVRFGPGLLVQMKAKWLGRDRFLEMHGGEPYAFARGRERLEFGTGDDAYSVFVGEAEFLLLVGDRWKRAEEVPGDSRDYSLLLLKEVNKKRNQLSFQSWQPKGVGFFSHLLVQSNYPLVHGHKYDRIRFLGSKTATMAYVDLEDKREEFAKEDWILFNKDGWERLDTEKEIEDYVTGRLQGELLVVDGIEREGGRQALKVHVFNSSRNEVIEKSYLLVTDIGPVVNSHDTLPGEAKKSEVLEVEE